MGSRLHFHGALMLGWQSAAWDPGFAFRQFSCPMTSSGLSWRKAVAITTGDYQGMAYHLSQKKTVKAGIVKIAKSQIDKAIEEVAEGIDRHEVVHQVRKRCKKLRGLIRLIRPAFPGCAKENAFFRDAAGELSYVRDAQSVIESFEDLVLYYDDRAEGVSFETIRT